MLVGPGKLIDPAKLAHVFCSPRRRAVTTLDLLLGETARTNLEGENRLTITDDITEWDYGAYEGLTPAQVNLQRMQQRKLGKWNIWVDGCEDGE